MRTSTARPATILGVGLLLGLLGDGLLRARGAPALNLFLWAATLGAVVVVLHRRRAGALATEAIALLAAGLLFAATLAWRDSPPLKLLALGATAGAFALPAFRAGAAWVRRSGVTSYAFAIASAAIHSGLGALLPLSRVDWSSLRDGSAHGPRWQRVAGLARGVAIAVPFLLVFGALFVAADAVFANIVADIARVDFERLASHVFLVAFFGWISAGYVYGFLTGTDLPELQMVAPRRPWLGITELGTALGLLALLFAAFVAIQSRYLFGGTELVGITPGLTYADYARRGFFELLAVSALMVPLLLVADWLLQREKPRDDRVFRVLAATQILLLLGVMASALQRMRLYTEAYGLTELRLYATSLLLWLGLVLLWLAITVLRGRRRSFAFGALLSAFLTVAMLQVLNPDAIIARTNLSRALSGRPFDASYVSSLSGDAVPVLLAALPELSSDARCRIARRLLDHWSPDREADWRNWSWSAARARAAVRLHDAELRSAAGTGSQCPEGPD